MSSSDQKISDERLLQLLQPVYGVAPSQSFNHQPAVAIVINAASPSEVMAMARELQALRSQGEADEVARIEEIARKFAKRWGLEYVSDPDKIAVFSMTDAVAKVDEFFDYLTHPAPQEAGQVKGFQDRVAEAHHALFHDDPTDLAERRDRFGEESNELQQVLGQTREDAHRLVDYTYDRPLGDPEKEIGAAALTLASLCVVGGWNMMECAEADLAALQTPDKIAKVRAKRATRHGRGPLPGFSTQDGP